jgi:hypothetical protein
LGPVFFRDLDEKSSRYFRSLRARWSLKIVDGFKTIAERNNLPG